MKLLYTVAIFNLTPSRWLYFSFCFFLMPILPLKWLLQDWLHSLRSPAQNENVGLLLKISMFPRGQEQGIKLSLRLSKCRPLLNCMGFLYVLETIPRFSLKPGSSNYSLRTVLTGSLVVFNYQGNLLGSFTSVIYQLFPLFPFPWYILIDSDSSTCWWWWWMERGIQWWEWWYLKKPWLEPDH